MPSEVSMKIERNVVLALVVGFAVCWFVGNGCSFEKPQPLANRPVLRWIAKAAKSLLWVAVFVEPAPDAKPEAAHLMHHEAEEHVEVGADGFPLVKHSRGW